MQRHDAAGEVVVSAALETGIFHHGLERFLVRMHANRFGEHAHESEHPAVDDELEALSIFAKAEYTDVQTGTLLGGIRFHLGEDGVNAGVRLKTSSFARNHPNAVMSRAKVVGSRSTSRG